MEGWSSWGMTHHVARVYTVTHADNHVRPFLSRLNLSRQVGFLGVTADTTLHPSHELGVEWETLLMSGGPYYVEGCTPNSWRPSHSTCARLDKVVLFSERDKVRGDCTPSLTLYAKTWDAWSICTSVGAWESVPDLERFILEQRRGCERKRQGLSERRIHTRSFKRPCHPVCIQTWDAWSLCTSVGAWEILCSSSQTWRDSTCARDKVS